MSGGVDSAVAAARLVDAGHEVVGVTLHLWDYPDACDTHKSRCCAPEDAHDARLVADHLAIPHYTFDRRELFADAVVKPFVEAYLHGRTPSPCVWCNRSVKMCVLLQLTSRLGAAKVATGHYARVLTDEAGRTRLHRGIDAAKDQSYFLYMLGSGELERVSLPLGNSLKSEVRAEALERGLPGADKGESQELCFVPSGDYADFVEQRADGGLRPGPLLATDGTRIGSHGGIHRFTVGQRRGLGVALGQPAFVTSIGADGAVIIGDQEAVHSRRCRLVDCDWHDGVSFPLRASVQVRSRHRAAQATLSRQADAEDGERLLVEFDQPVRALSPGQVAVAYAGDRVLGGGTIVGDDSIRDAEVRA